MAVIKVEITLGIKYNLRIAIIMEIKLLTILAKILLTKYNRSILSPPLTKYEQN